MDIQWRSTIQIQQPVERVYAYLSQFPRHVEWAQTLERVECLEPGNDGVGARYLTYERQAFQNDRAPNAPVKKTAMPAQTVCEVTALLPNQRIAWTASMRGMSSMRADWEFCFEPIGDAATRLTQSCAFHVGPVPKGMGGLLKLEQKSMSQFDASLRNIKLILG
jgi:hypothetical protein